MVPKKGKSKAAVARLLGISSQKLGQYMQGRQKPKPDFYVQWQKTFGEDLLKLSETFVSRETATVQLKQNELQEIKINLDKLALSIGRLAGLSKEQTCDVFLLSSLGNKPEKVRFREFPKNKPKGKT